MNDDTRTWHIVGAYYCTVHHGIRNFDEGELTCDMWNGNGDCDLQPLFYTTPTATDKDNNTHD